MYGKKYRGKYLVVGSTKHLGEIDSFDWSDPTLQQLNFNNYHTIILHFDAIPTQVITPTEDATRIIIKNEDNQLEMLASIETNILINLLWLSANLIDHRRKENLHVFVIASPVNRFNLRFFQNQAYLSKDIAEDLSIQYNNILPQQYNETQLVDLHYEFFSDLTFEMKTENNISMINANDEVEPYFTNFSSFDFIFKVRGQHTPLAHTFYNAELSFMQMIKGVDVLVLPHPKLVTPYDVNEAILRDIIGVVSKEHLQLPDWIDNYNTERQDNLISDIKQLEVQIDALKQQIKEKKIEFDLIRDFQRVLFTQGELLRKSLLSIFSSLGMKVSEPANSLNHDLELESADTVFIVQVITIEENKLERSVLRKLNQWVEQKEEKIEFTKAVKGLLLVNYDIATDPKSRADLILEPTAERYINKLDFCVVAIPVVFDLYTKVEKGELGKFELLELISDHTGIFKSNILNNQV